MKCEKCGNEVFLPFTCSYCGKNYCDEHRLPESHECHMLPEDSKFWYRHKKLVNANMLQFGAHVQAREKPKPRSRSIKKVVGAVLASLILVGVFAGIYVGINLFFTSTVDIGQTENYIFQYINQERSNRNLPTLGNDTDLTRTSIEWSNYLSSINNLTHGDFDTRMQSIGLPNTVYSCGEIIGSYSSASINGVPTTNSPSGIAREFVKMWLDSLEHREIMLTSSNGHMGVGVSRNGATFYGVVDFKFG
jgi:uncharacterized protein YkwD